MVRRRVFSHARRDGHDPPDTAGRVRDTQRPSRRVESHDALRKGLRAPRRPRSDVRGSVRVARVSTWRGRVGSAINGGRGAAYACALWTALMAYRTTGDAVAPVDGGPARRRRERGADAAVPRVISRRVLRLGADARQGPLRVPRLEPEGDAKAQRPARSRHERQLVGNATDGIVGAFGHWEGLERQRRGEKQDRKTGNTHLITNRRQLHPGRGPLRTHGQRRPRTTSPAWRPSSCTVDLRGVWSGRGREGARVRGCRRPREVGRRGDVRAAVPADAADKTPPPGPH